MQARLEIRLDPETKNSLDFLAKITGQNVSELIRNIVIPLTKIKASLEAIETIEKLESIVVKALIDMPEFQKMLENLQRYVETDDIPTGYSGEHLEKIESLFNDYSWTIIKKDGKLYPAKVETQRDCNEYGTCWNTGVVYEPIRTLSELYEFLKYVERETTEELNYIINDVKEAIKSLTR